jgi:cytidylate kinase
MPASPAILISGFTAAGKTTHARLLAEDLGWAYLGLSGVRRELPGYGEATEPPGAEWEPAMDRPMTQRLATMRGPAVVDAWLQPWLSGRADAVRVWLDSDEQSRLRNAAA